MKKHRLTKITIKTREIISLSKLATNETETSHCPICYAPINKILSETRAEKQTNELPAEIQYKTK